MCTTSHGDGDMVILIGDVDMDVSENRGIPKSSILIGFSIINHPFWGTPILGNTHMGMGCGNWDVPGKHSVDCRYHFF